MSHTCNSCDKHIIPYDGVLNLLGNDTRNQHLYTARGPNGYISAGFRSNEMLNWRCLALTDSDYAEAGKGPYPRGGCVTRRRLQALS